VSAAQLIADLRPTLEPIACFKCKGGAREGFMGVASIPCKRCGGSGVDPNPTEEEAHRFAHPPYWTSEGRQGG